MKIEILKDKILDAVSQTERIAGKHVTLPILSFIVIESKKDRVVVKATNLDVGVEIDVPAKVIEEGVVALSGVLLKAFLSNVTQSKSVTLETSDGTCTVSALGNKATFNTMSPEDFPVIPQVVEGNTFEIGSRELILGLRSVVWSSAVTTIKPELSSVYIYEDSGDLVFVATDSFRLAEKRVQVKKIQGFEPILIPFKNVLEIVRVFENSNENLVLVVSKNQLSITTSNTHLSSRVIDGNFPDYRQIIPKEFSTKSVVLKSDLVNALKLGSIFSNSFNQLTMNFNIKDKTLSFITKNNEVGESEQSIKGTFEGEDISLSFNYKFIMDCLSSIESDSVSLKVAGQGRPIIINPSNSNSFTYLVMSMNR